MGDGKRQKEELTTLHFQIKGQHERITMTTMARELHHQRRDIIKTHRTNHIVYVRVDNVK